MARQFISNHVSERDHVVDATAGNGWDTLLLAQLVGNSGQVFSFDIQKEALANTRELLETKGLLHRVQLIFDGHEHMNSHLAGGISAAMFNLGYLPGGEHSVVTKPETTIKALKAVLQKLRKGGLVTIVIYRGHGGGKAEESVLLTYASRLKQQKFIVLHYDIINQSNMPPCLLIIEKLTE